jgi:hypothetical protein
VDEERKGRVSEQLQALADAAAPLGPERRR